MREGFGSSEIDRDRHHTAQNAAEKRRNPLRAVFAPNQNPVALDDPARIQLSGETSNQICELFIGTNFLAQTMTAHDSDLIAIPLEVLD